MEEIIQKEDKEAFDAWWYNEGSGFRPDDKHDIEEFVFKMTLMAWLNGAYKATERIAKEK